MQAPIRPQLHDPQGPRHSRLVPSPLVYPLLSCDQTGTIVPSARVVHMKQAQLFQQETDEAKTCPRCGWVCAPLFPLELYKCGSCGCKWIPQAQVIKEPLFSAEKEGAPAVTNTEKAELEATIREATGKLYTLQDRPRIQSPEDAAVLLGDMAEHEQETLDVLLLNTRNEVVRRVHIYRGSLNSSLIRITELFREAVRDNAAALIVAHNHPSGDPSPSPEDIGITKEIVKAGKLLDVEVLDHLIIGHGRFISLKGKGLGFD